MNEFTKVILTVDVLTEGVDALRSRLRLADFAERSNSPSASSSCRPGPRARKKRR
jgi:hypothetical protein